MNNRTFCRTIAVCVALIAVGSLPGLGGEIALTWDMPTTNVNGAVATNLKGARLYYGTSSSNYSVVIDVGFTNAHTITGLVAGGTYYLNGRVYNADGLESDFCAEVVETATAPTPPDNQTPHVDAGIDREIVCADELILEASIDDDGLPAGSTIAVQWSKLSGPGTVSFSDSQALHTSVTFSQHGRYVLHIYTSDGEKAATDQVTVDVLSVPSPPRALRIRGH